MATRKKTTRKKTTRKAPARKTARKTVARKSVARRNVKAKGSSAKKLPKSDTYHAGKVTKVESLKLAPNSRSDTSYRPLLDQMEKLKKGESIPVTIPKGISVRAFNNRLNSAISRYKPQPPKGCRFRKRAMEDGRVAIMCVEA